MSKKAINYKQTIRALLNALIKVKAGMEKIGVWKTLDMKDKSFIEGRIRQGQKILQKKGTKREKATSI